MPAPRVLAADVFHPSYEGVAIMDSHIRQLCFNSSSPHWADGASVPAPRTDPSASHQIDSLPVVSKPLISRPDHRDSEPTIPQDSSPEAQPPAITSAPICHPQDCVLSSPQSLVLETEPVKCPIPCYASQCADAPPNPPPGHAEEPVSATESSPNGGIVHPQERLRSSPQSVPARPGTHHPTCARHSDSSAAAPASPTHPTGNPAEPSSDRGSSLQGFATPPGLPTSSDPSVTSSATEAPRYQLRKYADVAKPSSQK
ncbi:hypothetical protein HPB48_011154 [Haemaphysalis longicornis]|uniref:Uncharacterized protein n=1 Tax=Haemaphysalis longicornis TaxID=44386 RepID=A0A9J6FEV8_HAELO|nr:hypothetical protein HPB48_011154 [Haemaphysalis longicornis]